MSQKEALQRRGNRPKWQSYSLKDDPNIRSEMARAFAAARTETITIPTLESGEEIQTE